MACPGCSATRSNARCGCGSCGAPRTGARDAGADADVDAAVDAAVQVLLGLVDRAEAISVRAWRRAAPAAGDVEAET